MTVFTQIVKDYEICSEIPAVNLSFGGHSAAHKQVIFSIIKNYNDPVQVLDIGFGTGTLARMVKSNPTTAHWHVDGVDGYHVNCSNKELFKEKLYRNIWHGLAQDLSPEQLGYYDVICLLDVIEHLTVDAAKSLVHSLLSCLRDDAYLFMSTPLWFYPQATQQEGDMEEHLIGVPASSMLALQPLMYTVGPYLVGNFVYSRASLDFVDFFQPSTDKNFTMEKGIKIAKSVNMQLDVNTLYVV